MNTIKEWYRNIREFLNNLWLYRKILWNDRQWDYYYINLVLKHKLELTRDYIKKSDRFMSTANHVYYMNICIELLDKIIDNKYTHEPFDYFKSKLIFEEIEGKTYSTYNEVIEEDHLDQYEEKYKKKYKKCAELNKDFEGYTKRLQAYQVGEYNERRAYRLLYKILEYKLQEWWD